HRDAVFLHLAVGMVGAGANPEPAVVLQQHEFALPARRLAQHLDAVGDRQPRRRGAIEDRRRCRRLYAERAEFLDVQLDGGAVAPGPAGHHKVIDGDVAPRQPGIVVKEKRKHARRHRTSPPVALDLAALYRRAKPTQSSDREARRGPAFCRLAQSSSSPRRGSAPCTKLTARLIGTSPVASNAPASASSTGRRRPMTCSWNPTIF